MSWNIFFLGRAKNEATPDCFATVCWLSGVDRSQWTSTGVDQMYGQKCKGQWYDGVGRKAPFWDHHSVPILRSWSYYSFQKNHMCAAWSDVHLTLLSIRCKTPSEYTTVCATRQCSLLSLCQDWWWTHTLSQLTQELSARHVKFIQREEHRFSGSPLGFSTARACHRPLDALL